MYSSGTFFFLGLHQFNSLDTVSYVFFFQIHEHQMYVLSFLSILFLHHPQYKNRFCCRLSWSESLLISRPTGCWQFLFMGNVHLRPLRTLLIFECKGSYTVTHLHLLILIFLCSQRYDGGETNRDVGLYGARLSYPPGHGRTARRPTTRHHGLVLRQTELESQLEQSSVQ